MDQVGKIEKIQYCPQKGKSLISVEEQAIFKEKGLEGDYHGKDGDNTVTLWLLESRRELEQTSFSGICFQKFQENILVSGLDVSKLKKGDYLKIGTVRFQIIKKGKKCHPDVCAIGEGQKSCLLRTGVLFLKPISDGKIYRNAEVQLEEKENE